MTSLRIAMVSEHASPLVTLGGEDAGGQNVHVASLAEALARMGAEVVVHTRRDSPLLPDRVVMAPGVVVDHVDAGPATPIPKDEMWPYMDDFAVELQRRWNVNRPDVVHSHFWMSGYAAREATRELGLPTVHTFHALGSVKRRNQGSKDTSPRERVDVETRIGKEVDRVLATCSDEVFELARLGVDFDRVSVVPCGVDLSLFTPEGLVDERIAERHRVVFVGRLVERKGIGNVIEALAEVPDTELVIAGGPSPAHLDDDKEVRRLRSLARRYGVDGRVVFRGRVGRAELPALLRSADVVTCVPWYEPFGIVPLEAMACGVPVVAAATGGLTDTVVDGVTGLHVSPRRPDEVAAALRALLDDPAARSRLGRNGAARARSLYGWDRVARSTVAVYETLPALVGAAIEEAR